MPRGFVTHARIPLPETSDCKFAKECAFLAFTDLRALTKRLSKCSWNWPKGGQDTFTRTAPLSLFLVVSLSFCRSVFRPRIRKHVWETFVCTVLFNASSFLHSFSFQIRLLIWMNPPWTLLWTSAISTATAKFRLMSSQRSWEELSPDPANSSPARPELLQWEPSPHEPIGTKLILFC